MHSRFSEDFLWRWSARIHPPLKFFTSSDLSGNQLYNKVWWRGKNTLPKRAPTRTYIDYLFSLLYWLFIFHDLLLCFEMIKTSKSDTLKISWDKKVDVLPKSSWIVWNWLHWSNSCDTLKLRVNGLACSGQSCSGWDTSDPKSLFLYSSRGHVVICVSKPCN
jgi:hypothetical protein